MARGIPSARLLIESRKADAQRGNAGACFDLGIALATGDCSRNDMIEAHKWFTLASLAGYAPATRSSREIASQMSPAEIATARRRARVAQLATHLFA